MRLLCLLTFACATTDGTGGPDDSADSGETGDSGVNTPPVVQMLLPAAGGTFAVGEAIPFEAQLSDAEDDPAKLDVTWTGADGTAYTIDNTPVPAGHLEGSLVLDTAGEYTLTLAATDPAGNVGTASVSFTVIVPDALPECVILNPAEGELLAERENVILAGEVEDAETAAADLLVEWRSDQDGVLGESIAVGEGTVSLLVDDLSVGEHLLSLVVTDAAGGVCEDVIAIRVNGTPDVEIDEPRKGDTFDQGATIVFTGTVSDDREAPDDLDVVWYDETDDVSLCREPADAAGATTCSYGDLSVGEHKVWLGAEDGDRVTGWDSVTITVNEVPPDAP